MKLISMYKISALIIVFITLFSPQIMNSQGPNAPEAAAFEPVDATDMVDLLTGDFSYVLPLMYVPSPEGGYPIVLSYHSGIAYDQEASWVGLGWNINPGAINRYVNGHPDDWKGAIIRTGEHFEEKYHNASLGVGVGNYDVAIGVSWDSNKTWGGAISVGLGDEASSYSARVGIGYNSEDGIYGTVGAGYSSSSGIGIGIQADTRGFVNVGLNYGIRGASAASAPGIGISFSTKGDGNSSLQAILGESRLSASNSASSYLNSFGVGARFYLFGAYIRLGYSQTVFKKRNLEIDNVWGPLYFSEIDNPAYNNSLYGNGIDNEHNRDYFMDTYQQKIPKYIDEFIGFEDKFEKQKNNITLPAYDNYFVNAQGLSGKIQPLLLENGILIGEGVKVEYDEVNEGLSHISNCVNQGAETAFAGINGFGNKLRSRNLIVNYHYNNETEFIKKFEENQNIYFYFENKFSEDALVDGQLLNLNNNSSNLNQYLGGNYSSINDKKYSSDYVEAFTNDQIETLKLQNNFLEAKDYDRLQDQGYVSTGIGGYRITSADGKTYHFSRPVYHFEQINRQLYPKENNSYYSESSFYKETRKNKPYATHWLLTAITGPDYVKNSNLSYPSESDYGYWVRFDYGNWTNGYTWRFPEVGYQESKVSENVTSQEYSWGRKQLVYLNKIVTRTHTALFVKSLRQDNSSTPIGGPYPSYDGDNNVYYPENKSLKLDEIVLLKNEDYNVNPVESDTQIVSIGNQTSHIVQWSSWNPIAYSMNLENNVIDNGDFEVNSLTGNYNIYDKAQKIIKFNHSYDLATKLNNDIGRLTLNSVDILGFKGEKTVPPYVFDYAYKNEKYYPCFALNGCVKDDWGYHSDKPEVWSLDKVISPTGGELKITYDEDEYYTEALSRKYWSDGLKFDINPVDGFHFDIIITKDPLGSGEWFNFKDFFDKDEDVFFDFWLCTVDEDFNLGCNVQRNKVNIQGDSPKKPFQVSENQMIFRLRIFDHFEALENSEDIYSTLFTLQQGFGQSLGGDRNTCPDPSGCHDGYNLNYKLLANRTPGSGTGGGVRVSTLKLVDENLNEFKSKYDYNDPAKGRTSGITSYAPIKGEKYVAYQSQMPSPRVIYEHVSLTEFNSDNKKLETKRFKFDVLQPVFNIFDPNLQAGNHFKATVLEAPLDIYKGTFGVEARLEDNTGMIGALLETSLYNDQGHLLNLTKNNYYTLDQLRSNSSEKLGVVQESFHSMKSVYNYDKRIIRGTATTGVYSWSEECFVDELFALKNRQLNLTTKINYPNRLVSSQVLEQNKSLFTYYSNLDPKTGKYLTTKTQLSDNTWLKTDILPAHLRYPEMGSKVDNISNKHMLTQEAMSVISWSQHGNNYGWKTLNANITTWNKNWTYRDYQGNESNSSSEMPIWRKHKSYVWKDDINADKGDLVSDLTISNDYFDWGLSEPTNHRWQKTSEITKYTHWSFPTESKDINGNFTASKMADNDSKVILNGNSPYTEMYFSGAEYNIDGHYLDNEIEGAEYITNTYAHTGDYGLLLDNTSKKGFRVRGTVGLNTEDVSKEFRPGRYKVSFWVLNKDLKVLIHTGLKNGDTVIPRCEEETVYAGDWAQLNYYLDLEANSDIDIYVTTLVNTSGFPEYKVYDDFRMHPVWASVNSYVYDHDTDELSYILDANNMGSKFVYDLAGRLCKTYKEVESNSVTNGGFIITNRYKYNYKDFNSNSDCGECCEDDNQDSDNYSPLTIKQVVVDGTANQMARFHADVSGGSGNYTYEWKWLTSIEPETYSDYIIGDKSQDVPFVLMKCYKDEEHFDRFWHAELKVTDNITNEVATKTEKIKKTGCEYTLSDSSWTDIEVTDYYGGCSNNTKYSLRPYVIKPIHNNYSYYYRTYNHVDNTWSPYYNINSSKNTFCGLIHYPPSESCKEGQKVMYQTIQYRIVDNQNAEVADSDIIDVYLDCTDEFETSFILPKTEYHSKYSVPGNIVKKSLDGKVLSVENIQKTSSDSSKESYKKQ